jgi:hypothetical protein
MPIEWPWKRWSRERREDEERRRWFNEQQCALESGEEIKPPWVVWPDEEPYWGGWRQGGAEAWLLYVWLPFWSKLDRSEKLAYLDKWGASQDWRYYTLDLWDQPLKTSE